MFLLYKTQKENLNAFFKVISWVVIVVSICSLICCGLRCVIHGCGSRRGCSEMEGCEMGEGHGNFNKRVMIYHGEDAGACEEEGEEACEMKGKGCCREKMECSEGKPGCKEEMEGCKEGSGLSEKMKVVKDTVLIKRSTSK